MRINGRNGDNFEIKINSDGFVPKNTNYQVGRDDNKIIVDKISAFQFAIIDENSNEPVNAVIKIRNPENKIVSTIDTSKEFTPNQVGIYTFEINKEGYESISKNYNFKEITQKNESIVVKIKKASELLTITVYDAQTKLPINNATIKLFTKKAKN